MKPGDQLVDLLKDYLPRLEKIEGYSVEEYQKKQQTIDQDFVPKEGMTDQELN